MPAVNVELPVGLLCKNMTAVLVLNTDGVNNGTRTGRDLDRDKYAVLYIVVVLLFYSVGIVIAIVSYLKREKEEMTENIAYENYMEFKRDPDKYSRYCRVQSITKLLKKLELAKRNREVQTGNKQVLSGCLSLPTLAEHPSDQANGQQESDMRRVFSNYTIGEVRHQLPLIAGARPSTASSSAASSGSAKNKSMHYVKMPPGRNCGRHCRPGKITSV
jgi:hypothetical protein